MRLCGAIWNIHELRGRKRHTTMIRPLAPNVLEPPHHHTYEMLPPPIRRRPTISHSLALSSPFQDHMIVLCRLSTKFWEAFAWGFRIEKWRGLLVNYLWSPFPGKQSTKKTREIQGKFGGKIGRKFRTEMAKIRGTFVLQLF